MSTPQARGISESDVWQAADALLLEGARPTIERVRAKIGRGSPNTVSPHLDTWFRSLGARIADPLAFSAPPALPGPISQAATHFWEAALAAARAEGAAQLAAERAALAQSAEQLAGERARMATEVAQWSAQLQAKAEAEQLLRAHLQESQQRSETRANEIKTRDQAITGLQAEIAQLAAERDQQRQQAAADRASFEATRREWEVREVAHEKRWAAEVDSARETAKAAQARLSQVEKGNTARIEQLTKSLKDSEEDRRRLAQRQAKLESDLDSVRMKRDTDLKALAGLQEQLQQRETQLLAQSERIESQLSVALSHLTGGESVQGRLAATSITGQASKKQRLGRHRSEPSKRG